MLLSITYWEESSKKSEEFASGNDIIVDGRSQKLEMKRKVQQIKKLENTVLSYFEVLFIVLSLKNLYKKWKLLLMKENRNVIYLNIM